MCSPQKKLDYVNKCNDPGLVGCESCLGAFGSFNKNKCSGKIAWSHNSTIAIIHFSAAKYK